MVHLDPFEEDEIVDDDWIDSIDIEPTEPDNGGEN